MQTNQPTQPNQATQSTMGLDHGGPDERNFQMEQEHEAAFTSKMAALSHDLDAFISAGAKQLSLSTIILAEAADRQRLPS